MDFNGDVTITYNPFSGDRLIVGADDAHVLPCAICGRPEVVSALTVAIRCLTCSVQPDDVTEIVNMDVGIYV